MLDMLVVEVISNEGIEAALLALVRLLLEKQQGLVDGHKLGQIESVLFGSPEDVLRPRLPTRRPYQAGFGVGAYGSGSTHSPRPNRIDMTRACGKRTFTP